MLIHAKAVAAACSAGEAQLKEVVGYAEDALQKNKCRSKAHTQIDKNVSASMRGEGIK